MKTATLTAVNNEWQDICSTDDLVPYSGISALVAGQQVAIFYVPNAEPAVYALDNFCPCAEANVLSRGIVGDINGALVVASPIYKEHFRLLNGQCVEKEVSVNTWPVQVAADRVLINRASVRG